MIKNQIKFFKGVIYINKQGIKVTFKYGGTMNSQGGHARSEGGSQVQNFGLKLVLCEGILTLKTLTFSRA